MNANQKPIHRAQSKGFRVFFFHAFLILCGIPITLVIQKAISGIE